MKMEMKKVVVDFRCPRSGAYCLIISTCWQVGHTNSDYQYGSRIKAQTQTHTHTIHRQKGLQKIDPTGLWDTSCLRMVNPTLNFPCVA